MESLPNDILRYLLEFLDVLDLISLKRTNILLRNMLQNNKEINRWNEIIKKGWNNGLYEACYRGHLEIAKLMISKGADHWNGGLYKACHEGHLELANLMISKGANDWNLGLLGACEGGHLEIAKLMISRGADNWNGGLNHACYGGHLELVNLMISRGADNIEERIKITENKEIEEYLISLRN